MLRRRSSTHRLLLCVGLLFIVSACRIRTGDMTAISTRPLVTTGVDLDTLPEHRARGVSSQWVFLFIPLGGSPTLEEAVDDALLNGGGDLLLDPVMYTSGWWFLFGRKTIEVDGVVVDTSGAAASPADDGGDGAADVDDTAADVGDTATNAGDTAGAGDDDAN